LLQSLPNHLLVPLLLMEIVQKLEQEVEILEEELRGDPSLVLAQRVEETVTTRLPIEDREEEELSVSI